MHDSLDKVIFTWGKYKGHTLGSVLRNAPQYLQWITSIDSLPDVWKEASKRALIGESVDDLSLPRIKIGELPVQNSVLGNIEVDLINNKTAFITMPYNKIWMERFKYEIDGRTWNSDERRWEFPAVQLPKLEKLFPNANFSVKAFKLLNVLKDRRSDLDTIRQLEDTEFDIPGLLMPPYPYQKVGVRFLDRADGRALIADEPGLGKSFQAIAFSQLHGLKTLIIAPLSVVLNWQKEILKFTGKKSTIWDSKTYDGDIGGKVVGKIENYDGKLKNLLKKNDIID